MSLVHALIILPLSVRTFNSPSLNADRVFGWDPKSGTLQAVACGYFLWDSIDSIVHFQGPGFVVHGVVCFVIYLLGYVSGLFGYAFGTSKLKGLILLLSLFVIFCMGIETVHLLLWTKIFVLGIVRVLFPSLCIINAKVLIRSTPFLDVHWYITFHD